MKLTVNTPNFMAEAVKLAAKLSKNPSLRGSEALRGLKATINANKSLGKTISADVKQTIVSSVNALMAGKVTETAEKEQTNREINKSSQTSSAVQQQLNSLLNSMYNNGENGQGQSGSTTDIENKGGTGSKGDS